MIEIKGLAEKIVSLQQQAIIELTLQVQEIIAGGSQDAARIERTLALTKVWIYLNRYYVVTTGK